MIRTKLYLLCLFFLASFIGFSYSAMAQEHGLTTPSAIQAEHKHIHHILKQATEEEGELGEAARHLRNTMKDHFKREEDIAMPPLSLLKPLAYGNYDDSMKAAIPMTRALREEMPEMLKEHEEIVQALNRFRATAVKAQHDEYIAFADKLKLHAQHEEQVLYPAALLVGKVLTQYFEGHP